jgi:hypothetical protein
LGEALVEKGPVGIRTDEILRRMGEFVVVKSRRGMNGTIIGRPAAAGQPRTIIAKCGAVGRLGKGSRSMQEIANPLVRPERGLAGGD